jgi:predicted branched-subunit amino acid permease
MIAAFRIYTSRASKKASREARFRTLPLVLNAFVSFLCIRFSFAIVNSGTKSHWIRSLSFSLVFYAGASPVVVCTPMKKTRMVASGHLCGLLAWVWLKIRT